MPKTIKQMEFVNELLDAVGLTSFITALMLNISALLLKIQWNQAITFTMSVLGIIYICIKIYDACLGIRQKRKDYKK